MEDSGEQDIPRPRAADGGEEEREARTTRLLDNADALSKGAERAFNAGDRVAGIALITAAAQLVQLARLTGRTP